MNFNSSPNWVEKLPLNYVAMCQLYSKQILIQSAYSWKFTCNSSIHQNFTQKTLHHKKLWNTVLNSFLKALNHFQSKAKKEQRAQKYNCIWTSFNAGLDQNCKGLFLSMTLPTLKSLITFRSFQRKKEITLNTEEQASWPWKLITGWRVFMGLQLKSVFSCEERFIPISTQSMQCLSGESSISNFQGLRDKHKDLLKDRNIMANSSAEADRQNVTTPVPSQKGLFFGTFSPVKKSITISAGVFLAIYIFWFGRICTPHIYFFPHFPSIFWFFLIFMPFAFESEKGVKTVQHSVLTRVVPFKNQVQKGHGWAVPWQFSMEEKRENKGICSETQQNAQNSLQLCRFKVEVSSESGSQLPWWKYISNGPWNGVKGWECPPCLKLEEEYF